MRLVSLFTMLLQQNNHAIYKRSSALRLGAGVYTSQIGTVYRCLSLPVAVQSVDSDAMGARPLMRSNFTASDDAAYREASFAKSQDSMTQPATYSRLAAQSTTGRHVQLAPMAQKSRLAPENSADSFASVARSEVSFMSSVGGSRSKEQALADTYARACARLRALEVQ